MNAACFHWHVLKLKLQRDICLTTKWYDIKQVFAIPNTCMCQTYSDQQCLKILLPMRVGLQCMCVEWADVCFGWVCTWPTMMGDTSILATSTTELFSAKPTPAIRLHKHTQIYTQYSMHMPMYKLQLGTFELFTQEITYTVHTCEMLHWFTLTESWVPLVTTCSRKY